MARKQLKYWVGFDLGGTKMQANVYTENWKIEGQRRRKTKGYEGVKEGLGRMIDTLREALQESGVMPSRLGGIGMGFPVPLDLQRGVILDTPNLGWKKVPVKAVLEKEFKCPVVIANDVDVGTYGEYVGGAAKGARCALGVFPGTGIGGGLVYNGDIYHGTRSSCLEIGHICVQPDGPLCGCGRRGCLEVYASATGLRLTALELLARSDTSSRLRNLAFDDLTARLIFEAAREGDPVALESFEFTGDLLGRKLADAVAYTSPEAIFLFGGLTASGELLFGPTRRALEANLLNIYQGTVKLLPSGFPEGMAAILGASALIWKDLSR